MLLLQQKTSAIVVEECLSKAQEQKRETKLRILLCRCAKAEELCFIPPGLLMLVCDSNFNEHCLEQFLAKVAA